MTPKVKCPSCGKVALWHKDNLFRPFCSERCRVIDLGDWADESHRINGNDMASPFATENLDDTSS